tara:strand:+ start:684 stop:2477 length:1794 start_codon:yes stop_codon:yes gene_type:complete
MSGESLEIERQALRPSWWFQAARLMGALIWVAIIAIMFLEASFDLSQRVDLRQAVIALDAFIFIGLLTRTLAGLWRLNGAWWQRAKTARASIVYVALCLLCLTWAPRVAGALASGAFALPALESLFRRILGDEFISRIQLKPSQSLLLSFGMIIVLGTGLLMLPAATQDGQGTNFYDALFTMASAVSQTGLTVQDTGSYFSAFGQILVLIGMQIGGIGIMILSAAFAALVGGRMPSRQTAGLGDLGATEGMTAQSLSKEEDLQWLFGSIAKTTLWFEGLGVLVLYLLWLTGIMALPDEFNNPGGALWWSVFHAVSGFCQGGFTLTPDSLMGWVSNPAVNLVFIILITAGGLGFYVTGDLGRSDWTEIRSPRRFWKRLQLHTKIVLSTSLIMNVVGALVYLFFEYDHSLADLEPGTKVMAAVFQAVTMRCAGFNTVPMSALAAPTILLALVWMFVGSGPGSTGGGVRVSTACVSVAALRAMVNGRKEVELFGYTIPQGTVYKGISVIFVSLLFVSVVLILLAANENQPFEVLAFEVVSAFGTVGLSMGASSNLTEVGKLLLAILMFFGRVGPLTVALAFAEKVDKRRYRYAEEPIDVG